MMYVAVLSYAAPRAVVVVLGLPGTHSATVVGGTEKRQIILCPPPQRVGRPPAAPQPLLLPLRSLSTSISPSPALCHVHAGRLGEIEHLQT